MKTLSLSLALISVLLSSNRSHAQIIGSSVVTSVSVVLGNEATSDPPSTTTPSTTALGSASGTSSSPSSTSTTSSSSSGRPTPPTFGTTTTTERSSTLSVAKLKIAEEELASISADHSSKTESGFGDVSSVIATLKNIVESENQKHQVGSVVDPNNGKSELAYDAVDDEVEDEKQHQHHEGPSSKHRYTTTTAEPTLASMRTLESTTTSDSNVTATSAEVHEAIHRISGEPLTPGKPNRKPIENILTDVLTSINESRNLTGPGTMTILLPKSKLVNKGGSGGGKQAVKPSPKPSANKKQPSLVPTKKNSASVTSTTKKPKLPAKPSQTTARPQTVQKTTVAPPRGTATASTQKPKISPTSTTIRPTTSSLPPRKGPSTTPEPQIGLSVKKTNKISGLPTDPHGMDDNVTQEKETEEDFGISMLGVGPGSGKDDFAAFPSHKRPTTVKPVKLPPVQVQHPKPARPQIVYINNHGGVVQTSHLHPIQMRPQGSNKRKNGTLFGTRPTEFYDDEIFGYDPYQTFLHGVYIPEVELGAASPGSLPIHQEPESPSNADDFQLKSRPKPQQLAPILPYLPLPPTRAPVNPNYNYNPHIIQQTAHIVKPVPNLPDYLHRPRPSHLQYQHAVAETVDTETGLVTITVPHPDDPHQDEQDIIGQEPSAAPASLPIPKPVAQEQAHAPLPQTQSTKPSTTTKPKPQNLTKPSGPPAPDAAVGVGDVVQDDPHGSAHFDYHLHYHQQAFEQTHGPIEKRPTFAKAPVGNPGLETTVTNLDTEMRSFVDLNNRLALRLLSSVTNPVSKASPTYGNLVLSPFTITSSLGMLFLGARGGTAAQLDGLLHLDDMLTFNPHLLYYNVTQSFLSQSNTAAAIIRLLIADKSKGDVLEFFKTRVQHFYDTRVEEADYKFAGHLAQSIINQMIRAQIQRHSYEMLNYSLPLKGPMSLLTAAFFDGQFGSVRDPSIRDMNFVQLGTVSRRLVQVPAVAFTGPHKAVYDSELDATAVEVPYTTRDLSLILIMPGRPGEFGLGGVHSLKSRLTLETWTQLTRGFYARAPFKVVFPRFRHHSSLNISYTLQRFGLTDMFTPHLAKFKGVNGLNDLYLDQNAMHFSEFGTLEKLSDTLNEGTYNAGHGNHYPAGMGMAPVAGHKKFDLVRILRPHVREHYGSYGEPISVGDWIFHNHNNHPAPRFGTSGHEDYRHAYQPFLSYSRVRSGRTPAAMDLSQLFTRDSKTGRRKTPQSSSQQAPGGGSGSGSDEEEKVLRFERPFLYILRHAPTGMILMCGQYTDPVTNID